MGAGGVHIKMGQHNGREELAHGCAILQFGYDTTFTRADISRGKAWLRSRVFSCRRERVSEIDGTFLRAGLVF
jgi:hypothetical protein